MVEDVLAGDFDSIRDIVKNLGAEIENVRGMRGQVEIDDTLASVCARK